MSRVKHTAEEKRAIDRAWWALRAMTERSYKAEDLMERGYRMERRERSSSYAAKALMVGTASENWNSRAGTLFSFAEGCMLAALAAAEGKRLSEPSDWRKFKRLAGPAREAHWAAVHRALDQINAA